MTSHRYQQLNPEFGTTVVVPASLVSEQQALRAWRLYQHGGASTHVHPYIWQQLDSALARDSECALAHYLKGVLLECTGRTDEAREHLARARELDPDQRQAERALALVEDYDAHKPS